MFYNKTFQRVVATWLIATLNCGAIAPVYAGGKSASPTSPPTAGQLIPLQQPSTTNTTNNVLLPVGPRSLTSGNSAATTSSSSNAAAAFAAALANLHDLTEQANLKPSSGKQSAATLFAAVNALRGQYKTVVAQQQQMNQAFAATQTFLNQQGLPSTILQRHQAMVTVFNANIAKLKQVMSTLDAVAAGKGDAQTALTQLLQFVQQYPSETGQSPNSTALTWGDSKGKAKSQIHKETQEQAHADAAPHSQARKSYLPPTTTGMLSGIALPTTDLGSAPTANDLASTDEIQITPAVTALANSLGRNPVAIYQYVRGNVAYQVGYGSLKGSTQTLNAMRGNDIDSASLLIALYRAAGIPARYVYGAIEVPIARLQNWLQVDNPAAAQALLTQAGVPNFAVMTGGQISAVQLEHVWVQAFVDGLPSGGAKNRTPNSWMAVDPSFKQYQAQAGLNLSGSISLNQAGLFDSADVGAACTANSGAGLNQANIQTGFTTYQSQLNQLLTQQGPDLTVGGVLGSAQIVSENDEMLPNSLPYESLARSNGFDAIPANLQGALHIQLYANAAAQAHGSTSAAIAYSASYADLAGKRLTLSFAPATTADAATLAAYMPKAHADGTPIKPSEFPASVPGYLINVTANLMLDGQMVATGGNFVLGSELIGVIGNYNPAIASWNDNSFTPHAGDYHAIVTDTQGINAAQLTAVQTRLAATTAQLASSPNSLTADAVTGDLLNQSALANFATADANGAIFQRAAGVVEQRQPSYGRAVAAVQPQMMLGIVGSVSFPGVTLEIDQLNSAVASQSTGLNSVAYTRQSNQRNAAYAPLVLQSLFSNSTAPTPAVSAVSLLALAAVQSSPVNPAYAVTSANLAQVLPSLSLTATESANLQNAVAAGYRVMVAQNAATIGNWTGQGMLIEDPVTGAGAYRISGGASSGVDSNATAAIYPTNGMAWLALAQPFQAATGVTPEMTAAQSTDSALTNMLPGSATTTTTASTGGGNPGDNVRWSYFNGQADVDNGLFLADLASAEATSPTPCNSLTAILAANLNTVTGYGSSGTGSGGGTGGTIDVPVITSAPVTAATAAQAYQYPVAASDPAGAALTYSLPSAPTGMTIGSTGIISWPNPVVGISTVTVRADNGKAYAQQSYQLTVGNQALPLTISLGVAPAVINAGQTTTVTLATNGGTGNITTALKIDGQSVTLTPGSTANTGSAIVAGRKVGAHLITASATDSKGNVSQTTVYSVADPTDTGSPVAQITSPNLDDTLTNATPVIGTATDQNLAYYQLLIAPANINGGNNWTEIARGYSNVTNGTLGTFDPTQLPNGIYQLNLNVVNVNGVQTSQLITVEVNSHLKIGQFSVSFQDLNVNASGIPIQITRTYDTRRKAQNLDFGQGWSIDYQNLQINKNVQLGLSWTVVSNTLALTQCIQPGQAHKIDIILPTGELARFTASNSPQCALSNVPEVNIQFTPLPGTTSRLAIENIPQGLIYQGGVIFDQTGDSGTSSWNPQNYALTTADNYVYHLTEGIGITSVTDPNGNTLTYGQNGILHSNGTGIAFTRDANGHITQITDPSGLAINYTYSATGDLLTVNDRNNATSTMTYDTTHGLTSYTDPNGNLSARYVYDATGKLIAAYDANGNAISTVHNPNQDIITDQRGNRTTYTYDNNGNITQITNALNQTTTYTYDANGNQASVTDPAGNTTLTTYDPQSYLPTTLTDPLNHTNTWTYDSGTHSLVTSMSDANGNVTSYSYSPSGTMQINEPTGRTTNLGIDKSGNISTVSVAGQNTNFGYDAKGNRTSETDAAGNTIIHSYDANGNQIGSTATATVLVNGIPKQQAVSTSRAFDGNGHVIAETDALGNTTRTRYTTAGQVAATIDAMGRSISYQYDASGRPNVTTYPDGTTETNTYDPVGNLIKRSDRQGRITQYQYDALNRLTQTIAPDGSISGVTYDSLGQVATTTDADGRISTNAYDAAGHLTAVTDPQGKKIQYGYDAFGNRTSVTDALGNVTQFKYDGLNRLIQTTYPNGSTISATLRADGSKQSDTDANGNVVTYGYDADGRLNQVTLTNLAAQLRTVYGYDSNGNMVSQTDANGNVTQWSYDANGRIGSRILPAGQQENFQYDVNGNVIQHTDFNGNNVTYSYDSMGQVIQVRRSDGVVIVNNYTPTGRISSVTVTATTSPNNAIQTGQTTYTYDAQDRITKKVNPDGSFLAYAYDANGNVVQRSTASGTVNYAYDSDQRLSSVSDIDQKMTSYTYDGIGRLANVMTPDGVTAQYTYDSNNRLSQLLYVGSSGNILYGSSYLLSANGQRTKMQEFDSASVVSTNVATNPVRTTAYKYDGINRLIEEALTDRTGNAISTIDYQYDLVGNRSQKRITTAGGIETIAYIYDSNDRLTQETDTIGTTQTQILYTWDANGNLKSKTANGQLALYVWDSQNRLVEVYMGSTQGTATPIVRYTYDAEGNRVQKDEPLLGLADRVTRYLTDGTFRYPQVLGENVVQGETTTSTQYLWGYGLIGLNQTGQKTYAHADGLGSVKMLTDALGNVTDTYAYDAFGNLGSHSGGNVNPYRYAGEFYDDTVSLQYNRARHYDSSIGRFISKDEWVGDSSVPASLNKYAYANGDPVNGIDPSGQATMVEETTELNIDGLLGTLVTVGIAGGVILSVDARINAIVRSRPYANQCAAAYSFKRSFSQADCPNVRMPMVFMREDIMPGIGEHVSKSQGLGSPAILHRMSGIQATNRAYALVMCAKNMTISVGVSGSSCDEYAFASTLEGGATGVFTGNTITVAKVPIRSNLVQGGVLSSFYTFCGLIPNVLPLNEFVVIPVATAPTAFQCRWFGLN